MKKALRILVVIICSIIFLGILALFVLRIAVCSGWVDFNSSVQQNSDDEQSAQIYTITYSDDYRTYNIPVRDGEEYIINEVPQRFGYEFVGLFNAEAGGVQYVDSEGNAFLPFTDKRNITLYPQYEAKEYPLSLTYQGEITQFVPTSVKYGEQIDGLPTNIYYGNCQFVGWFTQPDCKGVLIADEYGIFPDVATVNEHNFDLTYERVRLYAGFTNIVTLFVDGTYEQVEVVNGASAREVVSTIKVNGMLPCSWALSPDAEEPFTGEISDNISLYALDYAPYIEFNSNGGDRVNSIVAQPGEEISLPQPQKRRGYFFAGWFTDSGKRYDQSIMPDSSISLKAGWYKETFFSIEERGEDSISNLVDGVSGTTLQTIDLSPYLPEEGGQIKVSAKWRMRPEMDGDVWQAGIALDDRSGSVADNAIWNLTNEGQWVTCSATKTINLYSNSVDLKYYAVRLQGAPVRFPGSPTGFITIDSYIHLSDIEIIIFCPDTSTLYI